VTCCQRLSIIAAVIRGAGCLDKANNIALVAAIAAIVAIAVAIFALFK
jgi:hypothetical protein